MVALTRPAPPPSPSSPEASDSTPPGPSPTASSAFRVEPPPTESVAARVAALALAVVPCDAAAVMVPATSGRPALAATSPQALDALRLPDGPELASSTETLDPTGHVHVRDTAGEPRWPDWGREVATLGHRSVVVVPLSSRSGEPGRLDLYAEDPDAFDDEACLRATELGGLASVAIGVAHDRDGLRRALDARGDIGIAVGVLVERYGLTVDAAFQVLVRHSQHHNVKLRDVARRLVEEGDLPDEGTSEA